MDEREDGKDVWPDSSWLDLSILTPVSFWLSPTYFGPLHFSLLVVLIHDPCYIIFHIESGVCVCVVVVTRHQPLFTWLAALPFLCVFATRPAAESVSRLAMSS